MTNFVKVGEVEWFNLKAANLKVISGAILLANLLVGCGYHLRGNTRPYFEHKQIKTLYVAPVKNNSYKAGVEITVYNALRKRIAQGGYVRLVDDPKDADAQFEASVSDASYSPSAVTTADKLSPNFVAPANVLIASSYQANLSIYFALLDRQKKTLWSEELNRSKIFQASTFVGSLGSTSGLINESDFDRALLDISKSLVVEADESVNSIF